jgi:ribosomal protein L11 methylase PrmA
LSLLGCKKVYATDLDIVLQIATENIKQNFAENKPENLISQRLEW